MPFFVGRQDTNRHIYMFLGEQLKRHSLDSHRQPSNTATSIRLMEWRRRFTCDQMVIAVFAVHNMAEVCLLGNFSDLYRTRKKRN